MMPNLETPRLFLRPIELADAPRSQELFPKWEIVRYLNNRIPWPYPEGGVLAHYRDVVIPKMERGDAWHWSLRLKDSNDSLIGGVSLMKTEGNNRGFWLGLSWHGRGLMSEAVDAVTDF